MLHTILPRVNYYATLHIAKGKQLHYIPRLNYYITYHIAKGNTARSAYNLEYDYCSFMWQYNLWNMKNRRVELAVLELYEGSRQSNSTAFSSFHPPSPPIVMRQAYIFPGHISAIATTVTEKGISSKDLLCKFRSTDTASHSFT